MSDIHGESNRFHKMLKMIDFKPEDKLYIIGDVIDRRKDGIDLLLEIMDTPNMVLLVGNHEQMCLDTLGFDNCPGACELWKSNGGGVTYRDLVYKRDIDVRNKILKFMYDLPDYLHVQVADRKFILVHGFAASSRRERVWSRPEPGLDMWTSNATLICGHTPTPHLTKNFNEQFHIYHGNGWIDIDCGCGNITECRRLACLRLDDMAEFYT